jgi:hypothetical protein
VGSRDEDEAKNDQSDLTDEEEGALMHKAAEQVRDLLRETSEAPGLEGFYDYVMDTPGEWDRVMNHVADNLEEINAVLSSGYTSRDLFGIFSPSITDMLMARQNTTNEPPVIEVSVPARRR